MDAKPAMTVSEQPIDGKYRILDEFSQIAIRADNGNPVDNGGSEDRDKVVRMIGHIEKSMAAKRERLAAAKEAEEASRK